MAAKKAAGTKAPAKAKPFRAKAKREFVLARPNLTVEEVVQAAARIRMKLAPGFVAAVRLKNRRQEERQELERAIAKDSKTAASAAIGKVSSTKASAEAHEEWMFRALVRKLGLERAGELFRSEARIELARETGFEIVSQMDSHVEHTLGEFKGQLEKSLSNGIRNGIRSAG